MNETPAPRSPERENRPEEELRSDCWDRAVQTLGTARIFETRARSLKRKLRLLTFLGIVVPATIGAVVTSFSTNARGLPQLMFVAGILAVVQIVVSIWALTGQWDTALGYSQESTTDNDRLSVQYQKLAK